MATYIKTIKVDLRNKKPIIPTYESVTQGLTENMYGKNLRAILNFRVVEKTKSFAILKIEFIYIINSRRVF